MLFPVVTSLKKKKKKTHVSFPSAGCFLRRSGRCVCRVHTSGLPPLRPPSGGAQTHRFLLLLLPQGGPQRAHSEDDHPGTHRRSATHLQATALLPWTSL